MASLILFLQLSSTLCELSSADTNWPVEEASRQCFPSPYLFLWSHSLCRASVLFFYSNKNKMVAKHHSCLELRERRWGRSGRQCWEMRRSGRKVLAVKKLPPSQAQHCPCCIRVIFLCVQLELVQLWNCSSVVGTFIFQSRQPFKTSLCQAKLWEQDAQEQNSLYLLSDDVDDDLFWCAYQSFKPHSGYLSIFCANLSLLSG